MSNAHRVANHMKAAMSGRKEGILIDQRLELLVWGGMACATKEAIDTAVL